MSFVRVLLAMGLIAAVGAARACAAGFEIDEQDVELLGAALAGRTAWSHNASVAWWNPAAMSGLPKGWNYGVGFHSLFLSQEYRDEGSTSAAGTPMIGGTTPDGGKYGYVPNLYLTYSLGEDWVAGFVANAPFGLATDWPTDSTVRYFATKSELRVINLEPVVSYRINEQWSVGGGLNIERADATLSNQIDFGTIGAGLGIPGLAPQMNDGSVEVEGDSWAVGVTLGVQFRLDEKNSFGLAYRTKVTHDLSGTADFTVPPEAQAISAASGAFVDTGIDARLSLPAKLMLSGAHEVAPRWTVLWDVAWTEWSSLEALNVEFDNPNQPTSTLVLDWKDSWRLSVGGAFAATDEWAFRAGFAWDQSPIPDSTRGPRLPGSDRFWLSVGTTYRVSDAVSIHVGYVHLFMDRVGIDQTQAGAGNIVGSVQGGTDILSIGVTGHF